MNFLNIDRRIIWLITALIFVLPADITGKSSKIQLTDSARAFYLSLNGLEEGSSVLLSIDIPPSFNAELKPSLSAAVEHAFKNNLKITALSLYPEAVGMASVLLDQIAKKHNKVYGKDYVYLGWQPAETAVITAMLTNITGVFATDYSGRAATGFELLKANNKIADYSLLVQVGAGFDNMPWLTYGTDKAGINYIVAANAGAEGTLRPYYRSGQIKGLLVSVKGAAEYESLLSIKGDGSKGLAAINAAQLFLVFLLIATNAVYLTQKFILKQKVDNYD